jgi:hypothetical protein
MLARILVVAALAAAPVIEAWAPMHLATSSSVVRSGKLSCASFQLPKSPEGSKLERSDPASPSAAAAHVTQRHRREQGPENVKLMS